jgi:hypothetical protein
MRQTRNRGFRQPLLRARIHDAAVSNATCAKYAHSALSALVVVSAILSSAGPAPAQMFLTPWREDPECRELVNGMCRLPPGTPASDWPMRVAIRGVTFPVWSPVDATAHMEDAIKAYWISGRVNTPTIELQWPAARQRIAGQIESGELSLSETTINLGPSEGPVGFWRIRQKMTSAVDLSGRLNNSASASEYTLIIHNSKMYPNVDNWPINKSYPIQIPQDEPPSIAILINGQARFVAYEGRVLSTLFLSDQQSGLVSKCALNYGDPKSQ